MADRCATPPWRWVGFGLVLLAFSGVALWWAWNRSPQRDSLDEAATANARGVGLMAQFEDQDGYNRAAAEFEAASRAAPTWLTPRVNLAIALVNTQKPEQLDRAVELLQQVLQQDPDHKHAHYTLGIIHFYRNQLDLARPHFEAVSRLDPNDAHTWYHLGKCLPDADENPEAKAFFQKALALNPYLNAARYALALHTHERDPRQTENLLAEKTALEKANWESEYELVYTRMGKYAECLGGGPRELPPPGPLPTFAPLPPETVRLAPGTTWAPTPTTGLPGLLARRYGAVMLPVDLDGDDRPEWLALSAVIRAGQPADLLLQADSEGRWNDVSVAWGLDGASRSAVIADFDNDGRPDVILARDLGLVYYRNDQGQRLENVSSLAWPEPFPGVYLGLQALDLDQDGDLDLLAARAGSSVAIVERGLQQAIPTDGQVVVWLNTGLSLPGPTPQLTPRFTRGVNLGPLEVPGLILGFLATDADQDRDVDLWVCRNQLPPLLVLNDRLLRFRAGPAAPAVPPATNPTAAQAGLVLHQPGEERSEVWLLEVQPQRLRPVQTPEPRYTATTISPPMQQALAVDFDQDGYTDVLGLSEGRPILWRGQSQGRFTLEQDPFGPIAEPVLGLMLADCNQDCQLDVILRTESGFRVLKNLGNGYQSIVVTLSGRRDGKANLRTNADGLGSVVRVFRGGAEQVQELTTLQAGLGQSMQTLRFGVRRASAAETVLVRWPDGVPQSELNVPVCQTRRIEETNRKGTSCPILHTWNGREWVFQTDVLGGGALGELGPDGSLRPARPFEAVVLPPDSLQPRQGRYVVMLSEPMDEVLYLDHVALQVVDLPATQELAVDERFSLGGPPVTGKPIALERLMTPRIAVTESGKNVVQTIAAADGQTREDLARRSWLGYADEHWIEFDFGVTTWQRPLLWLHGWIDYPYPESIFAATQAGVPTVWPVLEERQPDGQWKTIASVGFPAGLPKSSTYPLWGLQPSRAGQPLGRLRLRSNLQVYWDRIAVGEALEPSPMSRTLRPVQATLKHPGFFQETSTRPNGPPAYRADRLETTLATLWNGQLTRLGPVLPLAAEVDDRVVLVGPGDAVEIEFPAADLPPVPPGMVRYFVLDCHGWCKDTAPFTKSGGAVQPWPQRGWNQYPDQPPPPTPAQIRDGLTWHTRPAGGR